MNSRDFLKRIAGAVAAGVAAGVAVSSPEVRPQVRVPAKPKPSGGYAASFRDLCAPAYPPGYFQLSDDALSVPLAPGRAMVVCARCAQGRFHVTDGQVDPARDVEFDGSAGSTVSVSCLFCGAHLSVVPSDSMNLTQANSIYLRGVIYKTQLALLPRSSAKEK